MRACVLQFRKLQFRKAVDAYTTALLQRSAENRGLAAEDLHAASDVDAALGTVDLDLRFLGKKALAVQASRLHAVVDTPSSSSR